MSEYPEWFQAFLNAPTDDLPGYFGDWLDANVIVEEDEKSLLISWQPEDEERVIPEVRFYGSSHHRRVQAVAWLYQDVISLRLMRAAEKHEDVREGLAFAELPLRLTFGEEYANKVFGGPWEEA